MIAKTIKKKPRVFIAEATFEKWEEKEPEEVSKFLEGFIEKVKTDQPLYRYVKSTFHYTADGNVDFRLRFELKEFKGALSISHKRR